MKKAIYILIQCTWGILQTVLGLFVFLAHIKDRHYFYHGAVVTEWAAPSSVSLGMFVFVTKTPYFYEKLKDEYTIEELSRRLLVHEYGHTVQSMILGPFYLLLVGLPSVIWSHRYCRRTPIYRSRGVAYTDRYPEHGADRLGEYATGEKPH